MVNPLPMLRRILPGSSPDKPGSVPIEIGDGKGIPLERIAGASSSRPHFVDKRPASKDGMIGGFRNDAGQPVAWKELPGATELMGVFWHYHAVTPDRDRALLAASRLRPTFRGMVRRIRNTGAISARGIEGQYVVLIGPRKGEGYKDEPRGGISDPKEIPSAGEIGGFHGG